MAVPVFDQWARQRGLLGFGRSAGLCGDLERRLCDQTRGIDNETSSESEPWAPQTSPHVAWPSFKVAPDGGNRRGEMEDKRPRVGPAGQAPLKCSEIVPKRAEAGETSRRTLGTPEFRDAGVHGYVGEKNDTWAQFRLIGLRVGHGRPL